MTPDEFRKEFVEPSVEHWRQNSTVRHLAANAIGQLDALADVVWLAQGSPGKVSQFRDKLGADEPAIAMIRDACDSHKHGTLRRPTAAHISGERPRAIQKAGFFAGHSFLGGPPTIFEVLVVTKLDGSEIGVSGMIFDAMHSWKRVFERLGYEKDWLILGHQY